MKNNKVAVIGLGEIGGMIVRRMLYHEIISQGSMCIFDRHPEKISAIKNDYPGVCTPESAGKAVTGARYVFICIQPPYIPEMVCQIRDFVSNDSNLFISSSNVQLEEIADIFPGKITKFLPTINSKVDRGVIYAAHNDKTAEDDKAFFAEVMGKICGKFYELKEQDFPLFNNLAGCAPAFFAYFCECMCRAAYEMQETFSYEEIESIFRETFSATGIKFDSEKSSFSEVITSVGKPGGITDTALSALRECLPEAASELMRRSVKRHVEADKSVSDVIKQLV